MKKIITCLVLAALLAFMTVSPALAVSADASDDWVLSADTKSITHGDEVYLIVEYPNETSGNWLLSYKSFDLKFADQEDEKRHSGSEVHVLTDVGYIFIEVQLYQDTDYYGGYGSFYDTLIYVEQAYYDEYLQLRDGVASSYETENFYGISAPISQEAYEAWSAGAVWQMPAYELNEFSWPEYIYGCDSSNLLKHRCGSVFRDKNDDLYLLKYSDYDRTYFYAGGYFATDHDGMVKLYKLEDETLRNKLIAVYDSVPEDELDWLVPEEQNKGVVGVFSAILFGVIPLGIMVFAVVMLIMVKNRQYRRPFIILFSGAAAVLISCIVIFAYLI